MSMKGFDHGNRGIGIRDHQLILPSVVCSTRVSSRIAKEIGAITFAHQHGCGFIGNDVGRITDHLQHQVPDSQLFQRVHQIHHILARVQWRSKER